MTMGNSLAAMINRVEGSGS